VGDDRVRHADVRVIAATNADLEAGMRTGRFREDLYYRLNVIELRIPPLRERREEIPALVDHFMARCEREYGRRIDISPATLRALMAYPWPGNVRELENVLKRAVVLGHAGAIEQALAANPGTPAAPELAPVGATTTAPENLNLKMIARQAARDAERIAIREMLERVHWNRAKAARLLQVSYKALLYKIVECGLKPVEEVEEHVAVA
jgi:two-component system response regulator AtoC